MVHVKIVIDSISVLSLSLQLRTTIRLKFNYSSYVCVCWFIVLLLLCSQVCQCTVNSLTLRAPGTDEWSQRSAAPISCSLGSLYIQRSRDLRPPLHLRKTRTLRVHLFTLNMLSSDNQYQPYVCLFWVCDCTWNTLLWLDLFHSLKAPWLSLPLMCSCPGFIFTPHLMPCEGRTDWRLATAATRAHGAKRSNSRPSSSRERPSRLSMFTCTDRRVKILSKELSAPLANDR